MSQFREIALFTVPKPESPIRRYRVDVARNGPVTDRRASYTRRFRAVRVRHVGEGHEELRSNTILKTNSTFNNNSWRGRGAQLAASRVEKSPMSLPSRRERERRGEEIIQPISCSRSPFVPFNF